MMVVGMVIAMFYCGSQVAMCLHGSPDPVTAALHILLGDSMQVEGFGENLNASTNFDLNTLMAGGCGQHSLRFPIFLPLPRQLPISHLRPLT